MRKSIEQLIRESGGFHELTATDVGRPFLNNAGSFGLVLAIDIGKRCYMFPAGFSMENDAQRDARGSRLDFANIVVDVIITIQQGERHAT